MQRMRYCPSTQYLVGLGITRHRSQSSCSNTQLRRSLFWQWHPDRKKKTKRKKNCIRHGSSKFGR
jgi:hypothetical protein